MTNPGLNFASGGPVAGDVNLAQQYDLTRRGDADARSASVRRGDRIAPQPAPVLQIEPEHQLCGRRRVRAGQLAWERAALCASRS